MSKQDAVKANEAFQKKQQRINDQWQKFATTVGRDAYEDLMQYAEQQRAMFLQYCEDMAMPHPTKTGETVPLDPPTIAILLQTSRGVNIMRTYIANRVKASDVAQPTK